MAIKLRKNLHSRKFLNSDKGIAAIECEIETTTYGNNNSSVDATVSLSDCHRHVHLDFTIYDKKDAPRKMAKIALLIAELTKFQTALKKAADEHLSVKEKKPEAKKSTTKKPAVIKSKL
jgi:hypothetical protein